MATRRIILNFEEEVYCNESRVWYVLDYKATPFVKDIVSDVVKNLECCEGWKLYVNDVLAPEWTLSSVICSEDDSVKLIRMKAPAMECDESSDKVITIIDAKSSVTSSIQKNTNLESSSNQQKPPLKINNNFKRKYSDTTPIHKDRYTNRSRIYVSPVLPKTVPVADALKTAVKETLTFSSPCQKKTDQTSKCNVVADSLLKAKNFQDRVSTILNGDSKISDSNHNSSTTSSDSSDDDSCKRVTKKVKIEAKSNPTHRSSLPCATGKIIEKPVPSSSSDTESEPETIEKQPMNNRDSSSSSSSEYNCQNQSQKLNTTKTVLASKTNSTDESSEEDSDEEESNSAAKPNIMPPRGGENFEPSKKINNGSSSDSESDSRIDDKESIHKKMSSNAASGNFAITENLQLEESSDDESCEEETKSKSTVPETKPQQNLRIVGQNDVEKDYSSCANLEGTPRVSDRLAFKMLDLNEAYCPVISAYKEGIITAYNSSSQSIVVKLLPEFQKTQQQNGRFEMDDCVTSDSIELSLKQLIEPKLIYG